MMDSLTIITLIMASVISAARLVKSSSLIPEAGHLSTEDGEDLQEENVEPDQQERIVKFLALLDKAEKSASARLAAAVAGARGNGRLFGKMNRMDEMHEEFSSPSVHQEETADLIDDLIESNPMKGRHLRKVVQAMPRKARKRACFWKYCIQNK